MDALLSIKPEFAEKILAGEKQYEFRRTTFRDADSIEFVYMYASAPKKRIVGGFTMGRIVEATPEELWELFGDQSGIDDRGRFMAYFEGVETGYAITIEYTYRLQEPVDPEETFDHFVPPVSFYYLDGESHSLLRRNVSESMQGTQNTQLPQFTSD